MAAKLMDDDSLLMVADSFAYKYDTASKARRIFAYHHVKLFKTDMQGVCDSLYYSSIDSMMCLYTDPVLWSEANQLTGDTIYVEVFGQPYTVYGPEAECIYCFAGRQYKV